MRCDATVCYRQMALVPAIGDLQWARRHEGKGALGLVAGPVLLAVFPIPRERRTYTRQMVLRPAYEARGLKQDSR